MYGFQEIKESGKEGGKFGLNTGFIKEFRYNKNSGAGGTEQDGIDFSVQINDIEIKTRFFPVTRVYKDGKEITDTTSDEYKEEYKKQTAKLSTTLTHIVSAIVSEDILKQALNSGFSSFADYAITLEKLFKSSHNWNTVKMDIFLEWANRIVENTEKAYLVLPRNTTNGKFICKSIALDVNDSWKEDRTPTHLKYFNNKGEQHPFSRGSYFMDSTAANRMEIKKNDSKPEKKDLNNNSETTW